MRRIPRITQFRRHLRACLLLVQTALSASCALALSDVQLQYTRQVWRVQDGLPEDIIQAMQQTPDGYLWIGTTGGLARFDGSRFLSYRRSSSPALTENSVFCLLTARDGSLWLGTEGGGLLHFDHGEFHAYSAREGLTDGFVRSVIEDELGRLWVGTDNGLFRIRNGVVQRVDTSRIAPSLAIHSIFEDREHRIWAGGSRLLMFDGDQVRQFGLPGAFSQNRVKSILQTSDGTIWVGTVGGLQRLAHDRFVALHDIAATVRTLRQTADGTLWIGTIGHGLYTWANNELRHVGSNGLLPSNTVLSIYEDDTHQIWIGTQDGLVRLSRTPVRVVPLPGGSDPDFETISWDSQGTIWAVSSRVYAIHNDRATPHVFAPVANIPVRNVFRDRQGTLWIGTDGSGVYHFTASGPVHYSAPFLLANNFVRAFLQSRDGSVWIATDEGVSRINAGKVSNLRAGDGLVYFSTRALMEDHDGNLWIGTDQGLSCWNNGRFIRNVATEALQQEKIWTILQDESGFIWFGTRDHGLFRYRDARIAQFTTAQGVASNSIYQLLEDRHGQLWMSSPNTISSIPLQSLDTAAPENELHLAVTSYEMPYDADSAQMYGGRQPSGCIDRDGGIWFPSSRGAVYIFPEPAPQMPTPKLLLTGVAVDGREIGTSAFQSLSADASRLEISYAPLSLRSQKVTRFRYRLDPFDRDWTYAGSNRVATYTNLPAGQYRFRVVAFPPDNPMASSEASLLFRKQPHFYATWWFISLSLALAALVSLVAYRWRVRLLQMRFQAVLEERGRLAREMHDTVIQGCTSVSALLEAISSLERESDALHEELLDFARTQMRITINEARQAVWNLRHGDEPQQDISAAVKVIAEHASREFGVTVTSHNAGSQFPIPHSIAHEILMVIREAVYNAALHGKPSHIWIEFTYGPEDLEVTICDDGSGFDPGAAPGDRQPHYGITGMQERVRSLSGGIEWISARGQGTTVVFAIRRSALFPAKQRVEA
jgi:ligand-binding sensor domain-containing protein/anti-sigma regulatory factor (Ser/Thr protein kinase)